MKHNDCDFYVLIFCGLSLALSYDDLSYNKTSSQSSTIEGIFYEAKNAVDGLVETCMRTHPMGFNSPYISVWWKVDLGGIYNIFSISILFKNYDGYERRQRGRFARFSLFLSITGYIPGSTLCYKDGPRLPSLKVTITCKEHGRYLFFYNERLKGMIYPSGYELENVFTELCDVIVQGCVRLGVYGTNCDQPCPNNCKDNTCHIENGTCFECKPGWTGIYCKTKCALRSYGVNCNQQCEGNCRGNTACNHVTGHCDLGCAPGWTGYLCEKECADGTYGYDCVNNCSGHCLNGSLCNKQTGHCEKGCNSGYTGNSCNKRCSSGYFGMDCKERCSRYCINSEPCYNINGVCTNGCQDGYSGTHCNRSCNAGYYGANCSHSCSHNCKRCQHTDGLCTCNAGWMGPNCTTECTKSYGENCKFQCSIQCINETCDRFNGRCLIDCKGGKECDMADYLQSTKTRSNVTPWIVAFSITFVISLIFISATFIMIWRFALKRKLLCEGIQTCRKSMSNQEVTNVNDEASTYQDLNVSKEENTYQTLVLQ